MLRFEENGNNRSLVLDDGSVEETGGKVVGILDLDSVLEGDSKGLSDLAQVSTVVRVDLGHGSESTSIWSASSLGFDLLHGSSLGLEISSAWSS